MAPQIRWVAAGEENGHKWERGYHENRLVAVRCGNCGEPPINVMTEDFKAQPCRAVYGGSGKLAEVPRGGVRDRDPSNPSDR